MIRSRKQVAECYVYMLFEVPLARRISVSGVYVNAGTAASVSYHLAVIHAMEFMHYPLPVTISPVAVEYIIHYIPDNYFTPESETRPYIGTPASILKYRMRELCIAAADTNRLQLVRLLYSHRYYLYGHHTDNIFRHADAELASIIMSGLIEQDTHQDSDVPNDFIHTMTRKGFDKCVAVVINESVRHDYHLRLLSYSVGMNRLDYIQQVLDRGIVTVNDNKQHFYRAVKRLNFPIVTEFIRRGVRYNCEEVIRSHIPEYIYRRERPDSPEIIAMRKLLRDNAVSIASYYSTNRKTLVGTT